MICSTRPFCLSPIFIDGVPIRGGGGASIIPLEELPIIRSHFSRDLKKFHVQKMLCSMCFCFVYKKVLIPEIISSEFSSEFGAEKKNL